MKDGNISQNSVTKQHSHIRLAKLGFSTITVKLLFPPHSLGRSNHCSHLERNNGFVSGLHTVKNILTILSVR